MTKPDTAVDRAVEAIRDSLEATIASYGSAVVGYSAGVDSTVVAVAAHAALGDRALAVTAVTETITPEDVVLAGLIAEERGFAHRWIEYSELAIPEYAANPSDRCYFCKEALYVNLAAVAREQGFAAVLDGTNADDAADYRPGRRAAGERGIRSPLLELGIRKSEVRALAALYGLPNADKPSAPCLSSRVPYGTAITLDVLRRIGAAERALRTLGFTELRVRHHEIVARVEIPRSDFSRAIALATEIEATLRAVGYQYVTLDLGGFRSGSLNESLTQITIPR